MSTPDRTLRVIEGSGASEVRLHSAFLVTDDGRRHLVNGRVIRIGSALENEVVLEDPSVSRHHASVEDLREGFRLRDLDSTNGTWVNGIRSNEAFLAPGVEVRFGQVLLRFEVERSAVPMEAWPEDRFHGMWGASAPMRHLFGFLHRIAPTDLSILLQGETGTGKEATARAIHRASPRANHPFVVFDGATTEATFMAADLFGHREGAYTGATGARTGRFVAAEGGTLFLDEVGEVPLDLQPRLLRALERREVTPLGADHAVRVDVRIVAATHRDLAEMVRDGTFREDLFYRLTGLVIELPPLRSRKEDVVPLARAFLSGSERDLSLTPSTRRALLAHDWPGNVRELRNVIQRAGSLCTGDAIEERHLFTGPVRFTTAGAVPGNPKVASPCQGGERSPLSLDERERLAILEVLETTDWNVTLAADILGITRQTLRRKMNRFGIDRPDI